MHYWIFLYISHLIFLSTCAGMADPQLTQTQRFPILTADNAEAFDAWMFNVENAVAIMGSDKMAAIFDFTKRAQDLSPTQQRKCFGLIAVSTSAHPALTDILRTVQNRDGRAALVLLKARYQVTNLESVVYLMEMVQLRIDPSDFLTFEHRFRYLIRKLTEAKIDLPDTCYRAFILSALPDDDFFKTFTVQQCSSTLAGATYSDLLLATRDLVIVRNKPTSVPTSTGSSFAVQSVPTQRGSRELTTCSHCKGTPFRERGHTAENCFRLHPEKAPKGFTPRVVDKKASAQRESKRGGDGKGRPPVYAHAAMHMPAAPTEETTFYYSFMMQCAFNNNIGTRTILREVLLDTGTTKSITNTIDPAHGLTDMKTWTPFPTDALVYVQCGTGPATACIGEVDMVLRLMATNGQPVTIRVRALYGPDFATSLVASSQLTSNATGTPNGTTIELLHRHALLKMENLTVELPMGPDGLLRF